MTKETIGALSAYYLVCVSRKTNNAAAIGLAVIRKGIDRFRQIFMGTRTKLLVDKITSFLKQSCVSVAGAHHDKQQADHMIKESHIRHTLGA